MSGIKGINVGTKNWHYKHGCTNTKLFRVWTHMRERCEYNKHPYYEQYGGRGIAVCGEWREFLPFQKWALENGYKEGLTIDRIDCDKGYFPLNCRWVSMQEQQNNKRNNRIVEYNGSNYTMTELARLFGIKKTTLKERLNSGWSVYDAVNKPVRKRTCGYRPSEVFKMDGGVNDV